MNLSTQYHFPGSSVTGYLKLLLLLVATLVIGACAAGPVLDITPESLEGTWTGTWYAQGSSGPITIDVREGAEVAYYHVIDRDGTPYDWNGRIKMHEIDKTVSITAMGFSRVDTYNLRGDGEPVLTGTYTYRGKPWGRVKLTKQ